MLIGHKSSSFRRHIKWVGILHFGPPDSKPYGKPHRRAGGSAHPDAVAGFADTAGDHHVNLDIARQVEEFLHAVAVEAFHWAGVVPRLGHREHKRLRHQAAALVHTTR